MSRAKVPPVKVTLTMDSSPTLEAIGVNDARNAPVIVYSGFEALGGARRRNHQGDGVVADHVEQGGFDFAGAIAVEHGEGDVDGLQALGVGPAA